MSMYKCFNHRNIIMLECWNWTKDKVVWWWENWTNGKFTFDKHNQPLWKNWKNGCHFVNMHHMEKFQITDPHPQKFWSGFLSVDGNGISALAIMNKLKNSCHFVNLYALYRKISNYRPQSLDLWFLHESPVCSFTLPDIFLLFSSEYLCAAVYFERSTTEVH